MAKATKPKEGEDTQLQETMDRLNKLFGAGSIISGNQKSLDIKTVSTGSLKVDAITGVGGLPYGRIVEIYGPESSGKTTMCIHVMANAQKDLTDTRKVALIDMEHSIEPNYLLALGVDTEELILSQPPYGEAALEIADQLIKSGKVKVVVVDSIAALVPKAELDGETGEQRPGLQARMMGQGCRKLSPGVEHNNVLLIFTNQIREKIGVMYGNPETLPAGNAMKFYASMRIDIRKSVTAAEKEKEVNKTTVKIVKSKVSKPFGQCVTEIEWGKGFSRVAEILDIAEEYKVFEKSGSHYSYNGAKLANGREAMLQLLKDNVEMADEIEQKVLTLIKGE